MAVNTVANTTANQRRQQKQLNTVQSEVKRRQLESDATAVAEKMAYTPLPLTGLIFALFAKTERAYESSRANVAFHFGYKSTVGRSLPHTFFTPHTRT